MKHFPLFLLLAALPLAALARENDDPEKQPGFFGRLNPFRKSAPVEKQVQAKGNWRQLTLTMTVEPLPVKVSETRQLKVTLSLANRSKRFAQLEFPTTQRIEVLVKSSTGKLVEQWSEDRAFTSDPGVVSINPGEKLVFSATVATRDLSAGETYTVEGYFPNYEALRVQTNIVPEK